MVVEVGTKWIWPSHDSIIEVIYKKLAGEIKKNLNLDVMKDGSNDQDENFKDTALQYPTSYKKAIRWLDDAKLNYDGGNYKRASYCLGIASHYIIDTFQALHCVFKESKSEHHEFEVASDDYIPTAEYISRDLDILMKNGVEQGKIDWENWKNTKDPSIPHKEVDMGVSVSYSAIMDILS